VRVEAKFEIPSGEPYAGGWCRPQTDGPGLRARTLSQYGQILLKNNKADQAKEVFGIISNDLDWVAENWASKGCDLWEEFTSDSFFWGRMGYVDSLKQAAEFATAINETDKASGYTALAATIADSLSEHWNGTYLYEAKGREQDGAVIHAIASFGKSTAYTPSSKEAAATIK
jgi:glucoamylase